MNDFLLQYYSIITHSVELLSAVVGIILFNKYKGTSTKYFIFFLVYLSICDFLGSYTYYIANNGIFSFLEGTLFAKNYWWYTIFWNVLAIVFFAFY